MTVKFLLITALFAWGVAVPSFAQDGGIRQGLHTPDGTGEVFMGGPNGKLRIEVLVPPEATAGAFDVIRETHFKGFAPPKHYHPTASETFYVEKGRYTWTVGEDVYEVKPGDYVHVPANTLHTMISHDEGIVHMTYQPSGLVQRLRMEKAFAKQLKEDETFGASLRALTGHIDYHPPEEVGKK